MSDTTGNGNLSPRGAEAVKRGLEDLNLVVDELEAEKQANRELRTQIAGYKVAMEAFEARVVELESRERTAILERDQAIADRITWETLFVSINAQMRAFKIPSAPFVKDKSEEAGDATQQPQEHRDDYVADRIIAADRIRRRANVPDTSGSA